MALFEYSSGELLTMATSPWAAFAFIIRNGGLIPFFFVFVWMCWEGWIEWLQEKYKQKKKFVLMAVDVPRQNEQSMKAVEQIMATLHGVHFNPNFKEKYWQGVVLDSFALEIVSIDGYIQYFARCDDYNVDLVKGAIYAQYPDAEIVEVEDYTGSVPQEYPDEKKDMWGTEFILAKKDVYPIKTYEYFEHSLTGVFADPMAAILEILSRLKKGEQVWLQFILTPEGVDWREKGVEEVYKLIEKKAPSVKGLIDKLFDTPEKFLGMMHDAVFTKEKGWGEETPESTGSAGNFLNMTTGEKVVVEEVQKKISRIPCKVKFRFCYFGDKETFNPYRVVGSIFGVIKQFNTLDLNAIVPGDRTITSKPVYYLVKWRSKRRKKKLLYAYKTRSNKIGENSFVLSNVEIATLYHFPVITVRAPMVSKIETKKAEPPVHLPVAEMEEVPAEEVVPAFEKVPIGYAGGEVEDKRGKLREIELIEEQLHSMPGLPPGVKPAKNPVSANTKPEQVTLKEPKVVAPVTQLSAERSGRQAVAATTGPKKSPPPNLPISNAKSKM